MVLNNTTVLIIKVILAYIKNFDFIQSAKFKNNSFIIKSTLGYSEKWSIVPGNKLYIDIDKVNLGSYDYINSIHLPHKISESDFVTNRLIIFKLVQLVYNKLNIKYDMDCIISLLTRPANIDKILRLNPKRTAEYSKVNINYYNNYIEIAGRSKSISSILNNPKCLHRYISTMAYIDGNALYEIISKDYGPHYVDPDFWSTAFSRCNLDIRGHDILDMHPFTGIKFIAITRGGGNYHCIDDNIVSKIASDCVWEYRGDDLNKYYVIIASDINIPNNVDEINKLIVECRCDKLIAIFDDLNLLPRVIRRHDILLPIYKYNTSTFAGSRQLHLVLYDLAPIKYNRWSK